MYFQLASYDSQNIVRLEANKPDGYVLKARALFKLKLFKKAEEVLLRAIKIARQNHFIRSDVEGMNTYHIISLSFNYLFD
jgi:hypothetical protein